MKKLVLTIGIGQAVCWIAMLLMFINDTNMNTNLVSYGMPIGNLIIALVAVLLYFFKRESILGKKATKKTIAFLCIAWFLISIAIGLIICILANPTGISKEIKPNLIEFASFGFSLGFLPVLSVIIGEPIVKVITKG